MAEKGTPISRVDVAGNPLHVGDIVRFMDPKNRSIHEEFVVLQADTEKGLIVQLVSGDKSLRRVDTGSDVYRMKMYNETSANPEVDPKIPVSMKNANSSSSNDASKATGIPPFFMELLENGVLGMHVNRQNVVQHAFSSAIKEIYELGQTESSSESKDKNPSSDEANEETAKDTEKVKPANDKEGTKIHVETKETAVPNSVSDQEHLLKEGVHLSNAATAFHIFMCAFSRMCKDSKRSVLEDILPRLLQDLSPTTRVVLIKMGISAMLRDSASGMTCDQCDAVRRETDKESNDEENSSHVILVSMQ